MLLYLSFFFLAFRFQATTFHREVNEPLENGICNLTYSTVVNVQFPGAPTWVSQLLIVSSLTIGSNPLISQLGFLIENTFDTGPSLIDILIYDSPSRSYPGTLRYKISSVNLGQFPNNQISCIDFSASFTVGQTLWIGFWTYQNDALKVVSRQSRLSGNPYYYILNQQSPSVGSLFPSSGGTDGYQLIMGLTVGSQSCANLPCGTCTGNSNCVWCLNSQQCIAESGIPMCPSWTRNPNLCHICGQYSTCTTCASVQYNCTWCETNGKPSSCISTPLDTNCTTAITNPIYCNMMM